MTVAAATRSLHAGLCELREAVDFMRVTIAEDHPEGDDPAIVSDLAARADDVLGWVTDSVRDASEAARATSQEDVTAAVGRAQAQFDAAAERLLFDLSSYEVGAELARTGRTRGRPWRSWASSVRESLDHCRRPLTASHRALTTCWQELATSGHGPSVSAQSLAIGICDAEQQDTTESRDDRQPRSRR